MLLLFDVDGTLVRCGGAGRRALERAFEDVLGVPRALEGVRLDGSTDLRIMEHAFEAVLKRKPHGLDEIAPILERYLEHLGPELEAGRERYQVCPGALRLAAAASASGRCVLGLATGNIERGARLKLERAGLNPYFPFGGYGSDSAHRAELVRAAIRRGQEAAEARFGKRFHKDEILVIGDTEQDIIAAREAGALAVGVLTGSWTREALEKERPDLLVDTLEDRALWAAIGVIE